MPDNAINLDTVQDVEAARVGIQIFHQGGNECGELWMQTVDATGFLGDTQIETGWSVKYSPSVAGGSIYHIAYQTSNVLFVGRCVDVQINPDGSQGPVQMFGDIDMIGSPSVVVEDNNNYYIVYNGTDPNSSVYAERWERGSGYSSYRSNYVTGGQPNVFFDQDTEYFYMAAINPYGNVNLLFSLNPYGWISGATWIVDAAGYNFQYTPAITKYNGQIYVFAQCGTDPAPFLSYAIYENGKFEYGSTGFTPASSVSPVVFNGLLYLFYQGWGGTGPDGTLRYVTFDGIKWTAEVVASNTTMSFSPSAKLGYI